MKEGFVYFIKPCGLDGPIKIGHSWYPPHRLMELTPWSPWPLEVIGSVPGRGEDERFLHSCFADCHSHREWFHSSPRLRATIAKIVEAGSLDTVRGELIPIRSIRTPPLPSPEKTKKRSYRARVRWALKKLGNEGCYWTAPSDIEEILVQWTGSNWRRIPPREITAEELAKLDAFIADPAATAKYHERKLRVVK